MPKLVKKVLPDRSILNDKKFIENDKIEKRKCDILNHFQTLCMYGPNLRYLNSHFHWMIFLSVRHIYVLDCNTIMAFCQWCTFNAKSPLLLCRRLIHAFLTMSTRTLLQKRATLQLQNFSNFTLLHRWCYHTVFENRPKKSHLKLSILSGQKLNKNAKNGSYWRVFENLNSVTRQANFD